jgi:hypothetical protein
MTIVFDSRAWSLIGQWKVCHFLAVPNWSKGVFRGRQEVYLQQSGYGGAEWAPGPYRPGQALPQCWESCRSDPSGSAARLNEKQSLKEAYHILASSAETERGPPGVNLGCWGQPAPPYPAAAQCGGTPRW